LILGPTIAHTPAPATKSTSKRDENDGATTMISVEEFEQGLRLDQYMAQLDRNKENFRANFIKAIELILPEDLAFFRKLPKTNVLVVTDDDNQDALRDVPIISRLSVEVGSLKLKLFRHQSNHQSQGIVEKLSLLAPNVAATGALRPPIVAFFTPEMHFCGLHSLRLADLTTEMERRHHDWAAAHPEVHDAHEPMEKMSPITRTRLLQTLYAMTPDQRVHWGRKTVAAWRKLLEIGD
jgi:hypothetical protein